MPFQVQEVYDYMRKHLTRKDLINLLQGTGFSENIINVYFKVLEKMNLVQLSQDNYTRNQSMLESTPGARESLSSNMLLGTNTMKI